MYRLQSGSKACALVTVECLCWENVLCTTSFNNEFYFAEQSTESDVALSGPNMEEQEEESDDLSEFKTNDDSSKKNCVQPRWPTRVFAAKCVRRIIATCQLASPAHFDLQLAKELHLSKNKGNTRDIFPLLDLWI